MDSPNRLTGTQSKLTSINGAGYWTGTNLNMSIADISTFRFGEYKQLALSIVNPNQANFLTLNGISTFVDDFNFPLDLSFALQMSAGGSITIGVQETVYGLVNSSEQITITSETTSTFLQTEFNSIVQSARWNIIRSSPFTASPTSSGLAPSFNISIQFAPLNANEVIYFTSPVVGGVFDFAAYNTAYAQLEINLPAWLRRTESDTTSPPMQLSRFIDIGSRYLDYSIDYLNKYIFNDEANGLNTAIDATKSYLINPSVADFQTLLWLLPFVFTKPVTRYQLSPDSLPTPFILDESLLDSSAKLSLVSAGSLDVPIITRETQTALLRWQAEFGYYGAFAGTVNGVIEGAKQVLTGSKTLTLNYDWTTEPWVIDLTSPWNETFGGAIGLIGDPSYLLLEAASYAKPIGVMLRHEMTAAV